MCKATIREWFIVAAMEGMCANSNVTTLCEESIAELAIQQADAVLDLLEKEKS